MTRLKRKKELPSTHKNDIRFGTPQIVAEYRAERLCKDADTIVEVGAGAGFQTNAFAEFCENVIAVDIDEARLERGKFSDNVHVIAGDALDDDVFKKVRSLCTGKVVVFLDPQRPASAKVRVIDEIQPDLRTFVDVYSKLGPVAIELPPFLEGVPWECEREYISIDGELNRLTIYLGELKKDDVSVIRLPEWKRIAHSGKILVRDPSVVDAKYVLLPDRAMEHARLTEMQLSDRFQLLSLGNKRAFLTEEPAGSMFKTYKIVAKGTKESILPHLRDAATVILHGKLSQEKQKTLLRELNPYCTGRKRMHLFFEEDCILTVSNV